MFLLLIFREKSIKLNVFYLISVSLQLQFLKKSCYKFLSVFFMSPLVAKKNVLLFSGVEVHWQVITGAGDLLNDTLHVNEIVMQSCEIFCRKIFYQADALFRPSLYYTDD